MQNPAPAGKSSTGMDGNVAALVAYAFGWLSGLIIYLMEKENRFVRFHAMQSILLSVTVGVVSIILGFVLPIVMLILSQLSEVLATIIGLIAALFWLLFAFVILALWISCLVRAYQGKMFKLPIIGNMAENIVNK